MRTRLALAALLTALLALGSLPGTPVRAAEFKYDFEACEQGWTAKTEATWARSELNEGSTHSGFSMAYNLYAEDLDRGASLISAPHAWAGGKGTLKFDARWQFEYYPPEGASAGVTTTDRVTVDISTDGGKNFKLRQAFGGLANAAFPEFEAVEVDFDAPAGPVTFRFNLTSDFTATSFGFQFDDLVVPTAAPDGVACK